MSSEILTFSYLSDTFKEFLLTKDVSAEGKNIVTGIADGMYYPKIKIFEEYLLTNKNLRDNNQWLYTLYKITPKDIEESMEYYIDESRKSANPANHVKKRSVLENYRTVIYEYFKFLSVNNIKNIDLIKTFDLWDDDPDNFKKVTNRVSKNKGLVDIINTVEPISDEDFEFLYKTCDRIMNKLSNINPTLDEFHYNKYVRALIIKFILFTGIKCDVLSSIKDLDLDLNYNTICINGFSIHLPNNLKDQFMVYRSYRNIIVKTCKTKEISNNLFINNDGSLGKPGTKNDMRSNQFITGSLKTYIGRNDIIGLGKYVIIKMIEKGINQSIIQSFTNYRNDVFEYCQNFVNKRKNNYKNRYLDSKLRSMDIYDIF